MCGLFGWVGRDPKSFNFDKLNILGILNEERGRHSCGLSIDGDIKIGVDDTKIYRDLLTKCDIPSPVSHGVVIGHTRHATVGAHSIANAHPFGFRKKNNPDFELIGAHNGSMLTDFDDIVRKRGIKTTREVKNNYNVTSHIAKIDSELLLEALYKDNNYSILSEYNGAAALAWYKPEEPNTLYLFHGASREDKYDTQLWIERPMFVYQESKYSMYFSSLEESLKIIGGTAETITRLPWNKVYKIKNGDFKSATYTEIDRSNCVHNSLYNTSYSYSTIKKKDKVGSVKPLSNFIEISDTKTDSCTAPINRTSNTNSSSKNGSITINKHILKKIKKESNYNISKVSLYNLPLDTETSGNKVYEYLLRYWRNGKPITGIYIWVPNYGFHRAAVTYDEAQKYIENNVLNKVFINGQFVDPSQENYDILFTNTNQISIHYFFNGIRLKHYLDYSTIYNNNDVVKNLLLYDVVSNCSAHPIADLTQYKPATAQDIKWNNAKYTGILNMLGSDNIYTIFEGNITKVTKAVKDNNVIHLNSITEALNVLEENVEEIEVESSSTIDLEVVDTLDAILHDSIKYFPDEIEVLRSNYSENKRALNAADIMEDFVKEAVKLIDKEVVYEK